MALTETPKATDADTYVTLAELADYAVNMAWTLTGTDAQKEAALRRSAVYLDNRYDWGGSRTIEDQARAWPRANLYDRDGYYVDPDIIPQRIKDAQCELANLDLSGVELMPQKQGATLSETVKAGPVGVTTNFGAAPSSPKFGVVDSLVSQYLFSSGFARIVRG